MPAGHLPLSMLIPPSSGAWRRCGTCQWQQHSLSAATTMRHRKETSAATENTTMQSNPKNYHGKISHLQHSAEVCKRHDVHKMGTSFFQSSELLQFDWHLHRNQWVIPGLAGSQSTGLLEKGPEEGGEILPQVAQTGSGCPIPENMKGYVGQSSEQPDVAEAVPTYCRRVGMGDLWDPFQSKLFHESMTEVGTSACLSSWFCIKWKGKAEAQQWWLLPVSVNSWISPHPCNQCIQWKKTQHFLKCH